MMLSWLTQAPVNEVVVRATRYSACVDVIDSDHKPVWALLALDVPVTNQEKKRRMCSHILKHSSAAERAPDRPTLQLSSDTVQLSQVRPQNLCMLASCRHLQYILFFHVMMLSKCRDKAIAAVIRLSTHCFFIIVAIVCVLYRHSRLELGSVNNACLGVAFCA